MNSQITKNNTKKQRAKFLVFFLFSFSILFLPIGQKAQAWDPTFGMAAATWGVTLEEIKKNWEKTMIATVKMNMKLFIVQEIDNSITMITGGQGIMGIVNGQIESWEAFLVEEPGNQAASFLEEFLFNATGGRTSSAYVPKIKKVKAKNYSTYQGKMVTSADEGFDIHYGLIKTAKAADTGHLYDYDDGGAAYRRELQWINQDITELKKAEWSIAAQEPDFARSPTLMFATDNLRDMDLYFSGINNPWSYQQYKNMKMENNYQRKRMELALRALIGEGYFAESIRDAVDMKTMADYTSTWDLDLLKEADSYPEIVAYSALVSVNGVLKRSIRNVRQSYQKDLAVYRENILTKIRNTLGQYNPGELFKNQINAADARHNKFNTGYDYENKNIEAEINARNSMQENAEQTGQLPTNL